LRSNRCGTSHPIADSGTDEATDDRRRRAPVALACCVAALALVSGCSATVVGVPVPNAGVMTSLGADIRSLNVGSYPTIPSPPPGTAGSVGYGRMLEGQRMANFVVVPTEVDPELTIAIPQNTSTLTSADDLPDPVDQDDAPDFVVGFSTARRSPGPEVLMNLVLRFTDAARAADVAGDMAAAYGRASGAMSAPSAHEAGTPPAGTPTGTPPAGTPAGTPPAGTPAGTRPAGTVPIPRHPGTLAFASDIGEGAELHSATAYGPYVLFQYARSRDGADRATALVARTLDLQEPLIDRFAPDDPSRFADLPADTTGLLSRTLRLDPGYAPFPGAWVLRPRAALHFQDNAATAAAAFADAGVQAVSMGKATIYAAADAAGAQRLADKLTGDSLNHGYRPAAGVFGLPSARCLDGSRGGDASDDSPRRFYCVASAGRYAFEVYSAEAADAHHEVAAQYLMLTRAAV
jgi:hypothetical protein